MSLLSALKSKINSNPRGLYVLFYTEMWELFGRFGITALLVLYLTHTFHFSDDRSFAIYSGFIALLYVMPIIGGYLSDRILGLRHSVILGASLMALGNAMLIITHSDFVYLGLSVVAVGSGFFLPSIVPMVGQLYKEDRRGRDAGFTLYYIGKNIGALLAPLACGLVGQQYGYNYAFILSTLGMLSGIVVFVRGRQHLLELETENRHSIATNKSIKVLVYLSILVMIPLVYTILRLALDGYMLVIAGVIAFAVLVTIGLRHGVQVKKHLLAVVMMMVFVIIFSGLLGQGGTSLNLFIERIVDRHFLGHLIPPSFFYTLDPVFMILCGPLLAGLWTKLAKKGREPSEIIKFSLAMTLLAAGFYVFVIAAHHAQLAGSASPWFVVLGYLIFPIAELTIMPIGLSLVTRLSPKGHDAMMVGIWMLGYSVSGYVTGVVSKLGKVGFDVTNSAQIQQAAPIYGHDFAISALILVVSAVVLVSLVPLYKYLTVNGRRHVKSGTESLASA